MSRTLAQMRSDCRLLLDSKSGTGSTYTDAEINLSINRASTLIGTMLASEGLEWLRATTTLTLTSDTLTVPANQGILNVFLYTGGTTYKIKSASKGFRGLDSGLSGTIIVDYIPNATEVTTDGYTVTYLGVDLSNLVVDQYCTYLACNDLQSKEPEINPAIKAMLPVLEKAVLSAFIPSVSAPSLYPSSTVYRDVRYYVASPTTIKFFR